MAIVVLADGRAAVPADRDGEDGAGGPRGPVGVLVDDPRCGRLLLDCGAGVATRAAFAGVSLAGARVLPTGHGPDRLDPSLPAEVVLDHPETAPPGVRMLPAGGGEVVLLVETSRGVLLHCPASGPLPAGTVAALPSRVILTIPLAPMVRDQLAGVTVLAPPAAGRRVLVTGGARSGKSELAERMLAGRERAVYLATGGAPSPDDTEWSARVAQHRRRRPAGWSTVETADAAAVLMSAGRPTPAASSAGQEVSAGTSSGGPGSGSPARPPGVPSVTLGRTGALPDEAAAAGEVPAVLFDCVGTWLTAAMDAAGIWVLDEDTDVYGDATATGARARRTADAALARAVDALVEAWTATEGHVVAVTNEVGSGVVPPTAAGRRFRDELGRLNARLAAVADEVWLCTAGIGQRIR
ncbi:MULTISPECIES: bifunctional adenosylcobinamide kinase/adenosylcobinamide-phosphate guanylyltransferase [unclassified Pseudofrankia]|uniref:bifunctional adenosylcobinamide kinase/adenosylcobinamide-phosphate guanylyltransferase n=1 Tax=unclassified Pseudofrankia TaxID=2994372 RepID=UPI000B23B157|nr:MULTISPECIES: bifunctional adenosylcobinamide kinase/adenosylcobinamide-phosphate guanylyltransferase [unclassified Pseudofrankia]MDT3440570.1 bifunctional adenosylcobinamide kinase/adenosylcobinamide-phosphate guanylyltransferase [Pseudofrankia sp. BMG5.37]